MHFRDREHHWKDFFNILLYLFSIISHFLTFDIVEVLFSSGIIYSSFRIACTQQFLQIIAKLFAALLVGTSTNLVRIF